MQGSAAPAAGALQPPPPAANGSSHPHVVKGIRFGKNSLSTLHDLELALNAAVHVNAHLNTEIEAALQQLRRAEQERLAWEQHARRLAAQLAAHKRQQAAAAAAAAGGAGDEQPAPEQEQHLAEQLAALPSSNGQQQQQQQAEAGEPPPDKQQQGAVEQPEGPLPQPLQDTLSELLQQGHAGGWLANAAEVTLNEPIGRGAFGETYKAVWRGAHVAVKCVSVGSDSELLNFLREVQCLAGLRHPNVVPFLGAVLREGGRCWLISEYMARGTLAAWLHGNKGPLGPSQPMSVRVSRALEVCRGLAALEGAAPAVLHRDVKPSNVFLDAAGVARLGDFGLARLTPPNRAVLTGETGTYLYMSPEMIRHEVYDTKTDVWSFGVLLSELITGQVPYQHTFMTPVQIAMGVADETLAPVLPDGLPAGLTVLATACCDFDPDMRPSFACMVPELEEAVAQLQEAEAASGGLLGRLLPTSMIPSSWTSVLGQMGSEAAQQEQQQQQQQ